MSRLYEICLSLENKEQPGILENILEEIKLIEIEEQTSNNAMEYLYSL